MMTDIIGMMTDIRRPFKSGIVAATCLTVMILIYSGIFYLMIWINQEPGNLLEFWIMVGGIIGFCWIMLMLIAIADRQKYKETMEKLEKMKKEVR